MAILQVHADVKQARFRLAKIDEGSMVAARTRTALRTAEAAKALMVQAVRDETPVRTGALRDSTTGEVTLGAEGQALVRVFQPLTVSWRGRPYPLTRFIQEGHGAYDIYPRNKQALFWPGADHPVAHVHMPAKAGNPYIARAEEKVGGPVQVLLRRRRAELMGGALGLLEAQ